MLFRTAVIVACLVVSIASAKSWFVSKKNGTFVVTPIDEGATIATVQYMNSMTYIGWDILNVSTNASHSDADQAFAAGFGEGVVTYQAILNGYASYGVSTTLSQQASDYLTQNFISMTQQSEALGPTDPYWHQVSLEVGQFNGMLAGINWMNALNNATAWSIQDLNLIVAQGDLIDICSAYPQSVRKNWRQMSKTEFETWVHRNTHCSALIKLDPDFSDIFFGHATWATYNTMYRIYKHYFFNYENVSSREVSFSGYPGALSSTDDFYVTDTGLAIIETTNNIFNETLYQQLKPNTLLYWVRVKVATRMATDGESWMKLFGFQNSGTYNNQWMVLNLNLFTPYQDLPPGTLYIGEQIPGLYEYRDMTSILAYGYWPSYNVPFFKTIFDLSGYPEAIAQFGPEMNDYQTCARAEIFRRDQGNVQDAPAMQLIMQYNQFQTDPLSNGRADHAIAARGDLLPGPQCFGAIDAKISSWKMFIHGRQVIATSGPTPQQGIFSWANFSQPGCEHNGQPDRFDFLWQHFVPHPLV